MLVLLNFLNFVNTILDKTKLVQKECCAWYLTKQSRKQWKQYSINHRETPVIQSLKDTVINQYIYVVYIFADPSLSCPLDRRINWLENNTNNKWQCVNLTLLNTSITTFTVSRFIPWKMLMCGRMRNDFDLTARHNLLLIMYRKILGQCDGDWSVTWADIHGGFIEIDDYSEVKSLPYLISSVD